MRASRSILFVEDDEQDYVLLQGLLGQQFFSENDISWVKTPEEAVEKLQREHFDVCLLDFTLGARTGLDVIEDANRLGVRSPFILLTGQESIESDIAAMKAGAVDYLVKGQITGPMIQRSIRYAVMGQELINTEIETRELLAQKRRLFELLFQATRAVNESITTKGSIEIVLKHICEYMKWPLGFYYRKSLTITGLLEPTGIWHVGESVTFQELQLLINSKPINIGEWLPGKAMEQGTPIWIDDIASGFDFQDFDTTAEMHVAGAFGLPVSVDGAGVLGVMVFFSHDSNGPNAELLAALDQIGMQVGQMIRRRRLARELETHKLELEELVETRTSELHERTLELEAALMAEQRFSDLQQKFVALVSHELRTPLTIIDSSAQRLIRKKGDAGAEETLRRAHLMRDSVSRMTDLIDTTLTVARMESGGIEPDFEPVDLASLIRSVCERFEEIRSKRHIELNISELPPQIDGDISLLDQVFSNLLSNAIKYSPDGSTIEVIGQVSGGNALVRVCDQGVGIPEKELQNMFQRFYRASTSAGIPGTGLGLTLVKEFVELHHGQVSVESVQDQGSAFLVLIPAVQSNACLTGDFSDNSPQAEHSQFQIGEG